MENTQNSFYINNLKKLRDKYQKEGDDVAVQLIDFDIEFLKATTNEEREVIIERRIKYLK